MKIEKRWVHLQCRHSKNIIVAIDVVRIVVSTIVEYKVAWGVLAAARPLARPEGWSGYAPSRSSVHTRAAVK